jgi:hypothetical protein
VTAGLRLLLVLVAAGLLAVVAQSSAAPATKKQPASSQKAAVAEQGTPARADKRKRRKRRRPGCNRFCRQAGGFGAGPEKVKEPVVIPRQTVKVEDGIIAIRAHCRLRHLNCVGAILVDGPNVSYGRANLWIERRDSRLVRVFVPRKARRYLRRHHRDRHVFATVPLRSNHPVSISHRLTLLPDD